MKLAPVNICESKSSQNSLKSKSKNIYNQPSFGIKCTWTEEVLDFIVRDMPELEKNKGKVLFLECLQKYFKELNETDFLKKLRGENSSLFKDDEELKLSIDYRVYNLKNDTFGNAIQYNITRPDVNEHKEGFLLWKKIKTCITNLCVSSYTDKDLLKDAFTNVDNKVVNIENPKMSIADQAKRIVDNYVKMRESLLEDEKLQLFRDEKNISF